MAITTRTATNATGASPSPSVVLTCPTDAVVGDLLVASWTSDTVVSAAPSGWTQLAAVENTPKVYAYSHTYASGDPTSWTWTIASGSGWGGNVQAFGGVDTGTPLDVAVTTYSNTTSTTTSFPVSNSTTTANDVLVSVLGANTGGSVTPTVPSGWTLDTAVNTGFTSNRANAMAHFTKTATGGPVTYTWTIDSGRAGAAILLALRPSATAAGSTATMSSGSSFSATADQPSTGGGGSAPYASAVLALNPSLYLRLGDSAGTTAVDSSGNGRNGTYSGGYTLGVASGLSDGNKAASFVASSSGQVAVPSNAAFNQATGSGTAWSIVFRLRADVATSGTYPGVIGKGTTSTGWGIFRDGGTGALGYKNMGTQVITSGGVSVGAWAHWVVTNDGANIRFYKDGTLLTTAAFTTAHATTITTDLLVNKADAYGDNSLDEVSLHLTTLSQAQVTSLVTAQTAAVGVQKTLTGSITGAATTLRATSSRRAGTVTSVGTYLRFGLNRNLTGSVTSSGVKTGRLSRAPLYGAIFSTGVTQRGYPRTLVGFITAAGTVAKRSAGRFLYATITTVGSVVRAPSRRTAGTSSPVGVALKVSAVRSGGLVTASGVPHQIGVRFRSFVGSLTGSGAVRRNPGKAPTGSVTGVGTQKPRSVRKRADSVLRPVGLLVTNLFRRVFGHAGTCEVTVSAATDMEMAFYTRHRAHVTVELVSQSIPGRL